MNLELSAALGVVFGLLAAACAFVISYGQYNGTGRSSAALVNMALRSAFVTFLFFLIAAIALGAIFRMVM